MFTNIKDFKNKLNRSKKMNESVENPVFQKVMDMYYLFNTLSSLMDEGYIDDNFLPQNGATLEDINEFLDENGDGEFTQEQFDAFIIRVKNIYEAIKNL